MMTRVIIMRSLSITTDYIHVKMFKYSYERLENSDVVINSITQDIAKHHV